MKSEKDGVESEEGREPAGWRKEPGGKLGRRHTKNNA